MRSGRRSGLVVGAASGVVAIALTIGTAYACTALSTLAVSRTSALAGAPVTLTGAGFTAKVPVVVRWDPAAGGGGHGPVLASVMPTLTGHFTTSITVPAGARPSQYVIATGQPARAGLGEGAGALFQVDAPVPPPARSGASSAAGSSTGASS
ncbi:MAG: hypothetical protein ACRDX8_02150 [Acidimicrobiales bacterium]